jgi:hypothetical protein
MLLPKHHGHSAFDSPHAEKWKRSCARISSSRRQGCLEIVESRNFIESHRADAKNPFLKVRLSTGKPRLQKRRAYAQRLKNAIEFRMFALLHASSSENHSSSGSTA